MLVTWWYDCVSSAVLLVVWMWGGCLTGVPCLKPLPLYRPRDPKASDLWRLLDGHFDTFREVYEERFQAKYGFWSIKSSTSFRRFTSTDVDRFLLYWPTFKLLDWMNRLVGRLVRQHPVIDKTSCRNLVNQRRKGVFVLDRQVFIINKD